MRVITFSQHFPAGHPRAGAATDFVDKILACLEGWDAPVPKYHTIRAGNRWEVGDKASLRVWSGQPYRSKQVEFAQVEVVKTFKIVREGLLWWVDNQPVISTQLERVAHNDGLSVSDFLSWFEMHPKKNGPVFSGQVICWSDSIDYSFKPAELEKEGVNE